MPASSRPETNDVDLIALLARVRRWLPAVLILAVLAGGVAFAAMSLMAPVYTSEAQVSLTARATNPFPNGAGQGGANATITPRLDREAINTHVAALQAPDLLLRVAKDLRLDQRPEFNPALGAVDTFSEIMRRIGLGQTTFASSADDRVLEEVTKRLQVSAARESRYISLQFSSIDAPLAAEFANRLAQSYRSNLVEAPVRETNDVVTALVPQIEKLNREVIEAQAAVERYRAKTGQVTATDGRGSLDDRQVLTLTGEVTRAQSERDEARQKWQTAIELQRSGTADSLPDVQNSTVMQGLISQRVRVERALSEASATLLPAHPRMRRLQADLAGLRRSIGREVAKVVETLEKTYRAAERKVQGLQAQLEAAQAKLAQASDDTAELRALELAANTKRTELARLRGQLEDNRTLVVTRSVPIEAQLVSQARASGIPTAPRKGPISALVMAAAFMLGLAFAFAREIVAEASRKPSAAAKRHREISLAGDPDYVGAASAYGRHVEAPGEPVARAQMAAASAVQAKYRLETGLAQPHTATDGNTDTSGALSLDDIADQILEATEPGAGVRSMVAGATELIDPRLEAREIASWLSAGGEDVVVIEWSEMGSRGEEQDTDAHAPGINDLLAGTATFDDIIVADPENACHRINAGSPRGSDVRFDADDINLVLDALDDVYGQIVLTGDYADCVELFEVTEGRFDCGVVIAEDRHNISRPGRYLEFDVSGMHVLGYVRQRLRPTRAKRSRRTLSDAGAV